MERVLALGAAICLLLGLVSGMTTTAAAKSEVTCAGNFGDKVPVLMVHGWNSGERTWKEGETPMSRALGVIPNVALDYFDYSFVNLLWVTNTHIGQALAERIDCLAQKAKRHKVIVVAHSMGGLATRLVASMTISGRKVADELGLVITLGTPHLGSPMGSIITGGLQWACNRALASLHISLESCLNGLAIQGLAIGSDELRRLPVFPKNVPVRAIAGKVRVYTQYLFTDVLNVDSNSDMVVGVGSATAEYTRTGRGDGKFVFKCDLRRYSFQIIHGGQCWHNDLLKTGYVQESVKNGITEYLASSKKPDAVAPLKHHNVKLFGKLTLPYLSTWGGAMSQPGDVENIVDLTRCKGSNADCPHINVINLTSKYGRQTFGKHPVSTALDGAACEGSAVTLKGTEYVGGVKASLYGCKTAAAWVVTSKGVLIAAYNNADRQLDMKRLRAALGGIVWE